MKTYTHLHTHNTHTAQHTHIHKHACSPHLYWDHSLPPSVACRPAAVSAASHSSLILPTPAGVRPRTAGSSSATKLHAKANVMEALWHCMGSELEHHVSAREWVAAVLKWQEQLAMHPKLAPAYPP
eukprot:1139140-Pelagomonas_calceolata.AAC.10